MRLAEEHCSIPLRLYCNNHIYLHAICNKQENLPFVIFAVFKIVLAFIERYITLEMA